MTDRVWTYPLDAGSIGVNFDGGGYPIFPGALWEGIVPYPWHLLGVRFIADQPGNFRVNIKAQPFSTYFPGGFLDIHAAGPQMVGNDSFEDTILNGYTTTFDAHTCLQVVADNVVNLTRCTVVLDVLRG